MDIKTDVIFIYLLILSFVYYFVVWTVFYPKFRNMTHALSLSVLIVFKGSNFNIFILLYTQYIHVYNIEAVITCSSLSHEVQLFG